MKNVTSQNNIFWVAPMIALAIGLLPMPYGYYMLSRLIVSGFKSFRCEERFLYFPFLSIAAGISSPTFPNLNNFT